MREPDKPMPDSTTERVVLVTGPSGAGRSTAINALEDLGFEAIDNMPLGLLPRLLEGPPLDRPESDRLPPRRLVAIGNGQCPLILGAGNPTLAASLILLLRNGRADI